MQFVTKLHSVWSCEQLCLQRLPEKRQRWRRTDCFRQAVPDCGRSSCETSTADGWTTGPRNSQNSGRRRTATRVVLGIDRGGGRLPLQLFQYIPMLHNFRDIIGYFPKFKEVTWHPYTPTMSPDYIPVCHQQPCTLCRQQAISTGVCLIHPRWQFSGDVQQLHKIPTGAAKLGCELYNTSCKWRQRGFVILMAVAHKPRAVAYNIDPFYDYRAIWITVN